jgi:2-dehydro-3-deoxy-D-gluconate 5-dehydrogenase
MSVLDQYRLDGKTALVTGATRGIGSALAIALAEAGADVACVDILDCDNTCKQIEALGRKAIYQYADLSQATRTGMDTLIDSVIQKLGRLDILVNCAGVVLPDPVLEISELNWDLEVQINMKALFLLSQAGASRMAESGSGKIINIASAWSFQGGEFVASYAGTKHAVAGYTRAFAFECAPLGINVNAIAPGWTSTATTTDIEKDSALYQSKLERIPAGRWAKPDDYKGLVVFLASDASEYMHGTVVAMDGGWLIH